MAIKLNPQCFRFVTSNRMKFLLLTEKWRESVTIYNVVQVLGRYETRDQTEVWRSKGEVEEVGFLMDWLKTIQIICTS